jgi:hypothetical protein
MDVLTAQPESPNHALQRMATAVTARASAAAFPPTMHGPRQPPPSLSLRSLYRSSRQPTGEADVLGSSSETAPPVSLA